MLGLAETVQSVPFQDSTRVRVAPLLAFAKDSPTALHEIADAHDTPQRVLPPFPGLRLAETVQVVPFHDSIRVRSTPLTL
jgi:hypothetical protein